MMGHGGDAWGGWTRVLAQEDVYARWNPLWGSTNEGHLDKPVMYFFERFLREHATAWLVAGWRVGLAGWPAGRLAGSSAGGW